MVKLIDPKQIEGWNEMLSDLSGLQDVLNGTEEQVENVSNVIEEIQKKLENL